MKFLGLGVPELIIILVVVLLIFGPKNLPKLGNAIGKTVKSLREGIGSGSKEKKDAEAVTEDGQVIDEIVEESQEPEDVEETETPNKVKRVVRKVSDDSTS